MLKPESALRQFWDALTVSVTLYAALVIPLRLLHGQTDHFFFRYEQWILTSVFLVDIFMHFITSAVVAGKSVEDRHEVAKYYLKNGFVSDVISSLPLESLLGLVFPETKWITAASLLRFSKLPRLFKITLKMQQSDLVDPVITKIASLVFWVLLVAHWIACGWMALGGTVSEMDFVDNYIRAYYWCITTIATVGYGDITPKTNAQIIYTMHVMILGAGLYGYIIGNVANILAKRDVAKMHHAEKMERINAFLKYRAIPNKLQQKIRSYYSYLWESRLGYDESAVLSELPANLKEEVSLYLNREIIEKVAIFKGASEEMIRDLVVQLKPQVFTPGDFIFKAGEIGKNMYFICRGKVEVTSRDGKTVYATLADGSFFGEAALLLSQPRNASVRAVDYCDMYTLDKESFERVLDFYPEFASHVRELAEERMASVQKKAS